MIGHAEIERRLGFHPATAETTPKYQANRHHAITMANFWDRELPDGREKSLALTALQDALMWANAAIACNTPLAGAHTALRAVA